MAETTSESNVGTVVTQKKPIGGFRGGYVFRVSAENPFRLSNIYLHPGLSDFSLASPWRRHSLHTIY